MIGAAGSGFPLAKARLGIFKIAQGCGTRCRQLMCPNDERPLGTLSDDHGIDLRRFVCFALTSPFSGVHFVPLPV